MPLPLLRAIDALGIARMQGSEHLLQGVFTAGNHDCVYVVGHEAVGEDADVVYFAVFLEPGQIGGTVIVTEENIFATVAALSDVVRDTGKDGAKWCASPFHALFTSPFQGRAFWKKSQYNRR